MIIIQECLNKVPQNLRYSTKLMLWKLLKKLRGKCRIKVKAARQLDKNG